MSQQRSFTPEFKALVVLEVLTGAKSPAQACRECNIRDSLLSRWRKEFLQRAPQVFKSREGNPGSEARIAEQWD